MQLMRHFQRRWSETHHPVAITSAAGRPCAGGTVVMSPLPVGVAGQTFNGMDPSDPSTYVRPWNPQPGMIAYLNFDGAARQGRTPTGTHRGPQSNVAQRTRSQRTGRG